MILNKYRYSTKVNYVSISQMSKADFSMPTHLEAVHVCAEEGRKLAPTSLPGAFVTHLVVEDVRLYFYALIDVAVLQLHKSSGNGCDVALLRGEGHSSSAFWVLEFGVRVDTSVTNRTVKTLHDDR